MIPADQRPIQGASEQTILPSPPDLAYSGYVNRSRIFFGVWVAVGVANCLALGFAFTAIGEALGITGFIAALVLLATRGFTRDSFGFLVGLGLIAVVIATQVHIGRTAWLSIGIALTASGALAFRFGQRRALRLQDAAKR